MKDIAVWSQIMGDRFSPREFTRRTGLELQDGNEVGEIGTKGRFKGKPWPYGTAILKAEGAQALIEILTTHVPTLRACGAQDIGFHIDLKHDEHANIELDAAFIKSLAALDIPFTLTCWTPERD